MNHHRLLEIFRKDSLFIPAEIIAPFRRIPRFLQHIHRFGIADPWKWRRNFFKFRHIALQHAQFACAVLHRGLHHRAHQPFRQVDHVFQVRIGCFRLEHPEFGQVAARFRFFRAERRPEGIHVPERRRGRFHIELT